MLVHRHYTINNTMQPRMHNNLLDCLKKGSADNFDKLLLSQEDSTSVSFTIKNYK